MRMERVSSTSSGNAPSQSRNWTVSADTAGAVGPARSYTVGSHFFGFPRILGGSEADIGVRQVLPPLAETHTPPSGQGHLRALDVSEALGDAAEGALLDAQYEEAVATLSPTVREALSRLVGAMSTPFPVYQPTYFEGKKGLDGVPD